MIYQAHNSNSANYFQCVRYENFFFVPHIHRHPELIYVKSGEVDVDLGDRCERVRAGEYALIFSNCRHGYSTQETSLVYVCIFSEDHVPAFAKKIKGMLPKSIRFSCRPSVTDFAERELFRDGVIPEPMLLKAALYAVLGEFLQGAELEPATGGNDELIDRMIRYIGEHYSGNISLDSMAAELGYEKHYLSRCFNTKLKSGFSQYVNWYRIDQAKNLLTNTELSVSEIAFQCGFHTIRSFNRAFLQIAGMAPREFAVRKTAINTSEKRNV